MSAQVTFLEVMFELFARHIVLDVDWIAELSVGSDHLLTSIPTQMERFGPWEITDPAYRAIVLGPVVFFTRPSPAIHLDEQTDK